jgi:hypothetical protein
MNTHILPLESGNSNRFETVQDIVAALESFYGCTFTTCYNYIGGRGDVLLAGPVDDQVKGVQAQMLVWCGGWCIGRWGRRHFGLVDYKATAQLLSTARGGVLVLPVSPPVEVAR